MHVRVEGTIFIMNNDQLLMGFIMKFTFDFIENNVGNVHKCNKASLFLWKKMRVEWKRLLCALLVFKIDNQFF